MSGVGLGKLLVAVVKQGLQIGRCVHSGCGDLHFAFVERLVLLIWRSKHGWFDEREACTKKLRHRWRHGPNTTTSQTPRGGGRGGGLGGAAYKDRAWPLLRDENSQKEAGGGGIWRSCLRLTKQPSVFLGSG